MNPWVELLLHNWYIGAHEIHRDVKEPISKQTVHVIRTVQQNYLACMSTSGFMHYSRIEFEGQAARPKTSQQL